MTTNELIGTWTCYRGVQFGQEKTYKKPKSTMTFNADGTGTVKLLFIPMSFKWSLNGGTLKIMNSVNGQEIPTEIKGNEIHMMGSNNSYSIYEKR